MNHAAFPVIGDVTCRKEGRHGSCEMTPLDVPPRCADLAADRDAWRQVVLEVPREVEAILQTGVGGRRSAQRAAESPHAGRRGARPRRFPRLRRRGYRISRQARHHSETDEQFVHEAPPTAVFATPMPMPVSSTTTTATRCRG